MVSARAGRALDCWFWKFQRSYCRSRVTGPNGAVTSAATSAAFKKKKSGPCGPPSCRVQREGLLARSSEAMGAVPAERDVAGNDAAGRDITHGDLLAVRTYDVFEYAIAIEKRVAEVVANNHAVIADAGQLGVAVDHLPVIQRSKGAVAI